MLSIASPNNFIVALMSYLTVVIKGQAKLNNKDFLGS